MSAKSLSVPVFLLLLLIAAFMGGNHVAARIAFDDGLDVATAVVFRSAITALALAAICMLGLGGRGVNLSSTLPRERWILVGVGLLIGVQSLLLYASVVRLPVALALLAFNTHPLWTAFWARVLYKERPSARLLRAMPFLLLGLGLALDVSGAASGLGAAGQWQTIGAGVAFALSAGAVFGLSLAATQHELLRIEPGSRTATTLALAAVVGVLAVLWQGGPALPESGVGWVAVALLVTLYGTSFAVLFAVLPRLGVVGNSAVLSAEPVFALVLAWIILDQAIAPVQVLGALVVVGAIVWLGRPGRG